MFFFVMLSWGHRECGQGGLLHPWLHRIYMGVTIKKASAITSAREGRTGSKDSCRDGTRTGEGDRSSTQTDGRRLEETR